MQQGWGTCERHQPGSISTDNKTALQPACRCAPASQPAVQVQREVKQNQDKAHCAIQEILHRARSWGANGTSALGRAVSVGAAPRPSSWGVMAERAQKQGETSLEGQDIKPPTRQQGGSGAGVPCSGCLAHGSKRTTGRRNAYTPVDSLTERSTLATV